MSRIDDLERDDDTGDPILASLYLTTRAEPLIRSVVELLVARINQATMPAALPPEVVRWMREAKAVLEMCTNDDVPPKVVTHDLAERCPLPADEEAEA